MPNFRHGRVSHIEFDTIDVSDSWDGTGLQRAIDSAEVTTYQLNDRTYLAGLHDAEFPIAGHFDLTVATQLTGYLGSSNVLPIVYGPEGSTGDLTKYVFDALVIDLNVISAVGESVKINGKAKVTGSILSTTFSTHAIG